MVVFILLGVFLILGIYLVILSLKNLKEIKSSKGWVVIKGEVVDYNEHIKYNWYHKDVIDSKYTGIVCKYKVNGIEYVNESENCMRSKNTYPVGTTIFIWLNQSDYNQFVLDYPNYKRGGYIYLVVTLLFLLTTLLFFSIWFVPEHMPSKSILFNDGLGALVIVSSFLLLPLGYLWLEYKMFKDSADKEKNWHKVIATVEDIKEEKHKNTNEDSSRVYDYRYYLKCSYNINEKYYSVMSDSYLSNLEDVKIGRSMTIWVNPNNHHDYSLKLDSSASRFGKVFLVVLAITLMILPMINLVIDEIIRSLK